MSKKADVNWIIVGFVLALIVLAITAYIFWSKSKSSEQAATGILDCKARGGNCYSESAKTGQGVCFKGMGCKEGEYCCIASEG